MTTPALGAVAHPPPFAATGPAASPPRPSPPGPAADGPPPFTLRADRSLPYRALLDALRAAHASGVRRARVIVEP